MSIRKTVNRPDVIFMMSESPCSPQSRLSAWGILADTKRTWMVFAMSDKHRGKCFTNWLGRASSVSLLSAGVLYCFWSPQKVSPFKEVLVYTSWGIRSVMTGASHSCFHRRLSSSLIWVILIFSVRNRVTANNELPSLYFPPLSCERCHLRETFLPLISCMNRDTVVDLQGHELFK